MPPSPTSLWKTLRMRSGRIVSSRLTTCLSDSPSFGNPPGWIGSFEPEVDLALDRQTKARDELLEIASDHPIAPLALLLRGQVEVKLGHLPAAEAAFLEATRLEPDFVKAHRELTYIYSIQHRLPELDLQLAALSELGEMPPSYVLYWTRVRNGIWNADKDLPRLREFVSGDPSDRWSRLSLAEGLRRSGLPAEAGQILEELASDDPEAVALRPDRARSTGFRGHRDDSRPGFPECPKCRTLAG